jgi:uncharacterized protein YcaQ
MILRRENFQRVYDLTERVLAHIGIEPASTLSAAQVRREHALRSVRALGIAQARWIADYFRSATRFSDDELQPLVDAGNLIRVAVNGWDDCAYVHHDHAGLLARAQQGRLRATHSTLLSPFDPVVWDRARASAMFGFEYTLECYTPGPKRRYGYFVLPILRRGRLVGRLDAKAHRADGTFEIKKLFLEPETTVDESLTNDIAAAIQRCADWHETPRVIVRRSDPPGFAKRLREALATRGR